MITKITGKLNRVSEEAAYVQVGGLEYQVLLPEFVRRQVQIHVGETVTLHTSEFLEGNPMQGRVVPRFIGFLHEAELDFFELFCTVNKVGIRKALMAMARPIREIANAIQREDSKWLTSLPGIGGATAEQIVTTLKRKVTKFALMPTPTAEGKTEQEQAPVDGQIFEDAYQALLSVGHTPMDARDRLDKVMTKGRKFKSVEDILVAIYEKQDG